ncbi:MAG: ferredoxin family protein [Candidatus Thorarchaeota archaeon]
MPIDRIFRERWKTVRDHFGHPVWQSPDSEVDEIHGSLVGVDFSLCYSCEKCINACPTHVFDLIHDRSGRPVVDPIREDDCILCLVCEIVCPVEAISIERERGSDDTLNSLLEGTRG